MKLSKKKMFSIIICSLAAFLFINSFIPHVKISTSYYSASGNLWSSGLKSTAIILLFCYIGVISCYLLNMFGKFKDKWMSYVNYATGFIVLTYLTFFFGYMENIYVGIWLGLLASLGLGVLSVLWNFASDTPMTIGAPITGYDPATGKPIYAKVSGYDPTTGKPIYEKKDVNSN